MNYYIFNGNLLFSKKVRREREKEEE